MTKKSDEQIADLLESIRSRLSPGNMKSQQIGASAIQQSKSDGSPAKSASTIVMQNHLIPDLVHQKRLEGFEELLIDPIDELQQLKEAYGIEDYFVKFEQLSTSLNLCEAVLVSVFLAGLSPDTQLNVAMFQPQTIRQCLSIGRLYERAHPKQHGDIKHKESPPKSVNSMVCQQVQTEIPKEVTAPPQKVMYTEMNDVGAVEVELEDERLEEQQFTILDNIMKKELAFQCVERELRELNITGDHEEVNKSDLSLTGQVWEPGGLWLKQDQGSVVREGEVNRPVDAYTLPYVDVFGSLQLRSSPAQIERSEAHIEHQPKNIIVKSRRNIESAYGELWVKNIQEACNLFESIYNQAEAKDGCVSVQASKRLQNVVNGCNIYVMNSTEIVLEIETTISDLRTVKAVELGTMKEEKQLALKEVDVPYYEIKDHVSQVWHRWKNKKTSGFINATATLSTIWINNSLMVIMVNATTWTWNHEAAISVHHHYKGSLLPSVYQLFLELRP